MSKISLVGLALRFMAADRTAAAVYILAAVRGMTVRLNFFYDHSVGKFGINFTSSHCVYDRVTVMVFFLTKRVLRYI